MATINKKADHQSASSLKVGLSGLPNITLSSAIAIAVKGNRVPFTLAHNNPIKNQNC